MSIGARRLKAGLLTSEGDAGVVAVRDQVEEEKLCTPFMNDPG